MTDEQLDKEMSDQVCKNHTPEPAGLSYMGFMDWLQEMSKTHKQVKCPDCGLYKVWVQSSVCESATDHDEQDTDAKT